jgi:hypothetical protein
MPGEPTYALPAVGSVTAGNASRKLAEQLAAVAQMNEIAETDSDATYETHFLLQPSAGNLSGRLEHWLDELSANLKAITSELPEVASYSLQVGFPWGVSVSVTFNSGVRDDGGPAREP